jgi:lipoate-protein ligase A
MKSWRLLNDGAASGAWNMAVDEALWRSASEFGLASLRFYAWEPFCLSVGRLQKQLPTAALEERDFDLVRRPTGGRAVWHAHELTYAFAAPLEVLPPDARSVNGAYEWLSRSFVLGLQELGIPVEMAPSGVRTRGSNCFAASAHCDFVVDGKKLIGAAQCRDERAFLQHGSLLLRIEREQWERVAGGPMDSAISLEDLGLNAPPEQIRSALASGFERASGISLTPSVLRETETELAHALEISKYRDKDWTWSGQNDAQIGG